jgi:DNA-repair protein complementing XP-A cells
MRKRQSNYCEYDLSTLVDTKGGFLLLDKVEPEKIESEPVYSQCECCGSIDIHQDYYKHYKISVCRDCTRKPIYSQLTKTEAKQDYLLSESELKSLPFIIKKNPHKSTFSDMLLYLRKQLELFAIEKYGSLEELDMEMGKRETAKQERKQKVFKKKLLELRKKTRTSLVLEVDHQHQFEDLGDGKQICSCGFVVEYEEL